MQSRTLDTWRALARRLAAGEPPAWPDDVPAAEYTRSPAAATIARLAADSGLFHFHFEGRHHAPHPAAWVPEHAAELANPPGWTDGVLPERKYQSFRHDLMVASYHPHHRAKWAAHELCHGLVGFGWRSDATPFFHATAGRLAELLPVALWYFFDEAFLRRCPDHADAGLLFQVHCPRCEALAAADPDDAYAEARLREGVAFVDAELAAVARSRRLGRPLSHRWATIDLASDGVAYARAHAARLASPAFHRFAERFLVDGGGWSSSLDALEARVQAVATGLLGGPDPAPWAPTPAQGRARWIVQDVAFRLATVWAETDGEAADELDAALDALAAVIPWTCAPSGGGPSPVEDALRAAREAYEALYADFELPEPADVFRLGYAAPAAEDGATELEEGLSSCLPELLELLGPRRGALVREFARTEGLRRAHVARRFADHVADRHPGLVGELATWHASLVTLPPRPVDLLDGPGEGDRLAPHAAAQVFEHDVLEIAEGLSDGRLELVWPAEGPPQLRAHQGAVPSPRRTGLLAARDDAGELVLLDVDPDTAAALLADPEHGAALLDPDERAALRAHGMLVPNLLCERVLHERDGTRHIDPEPVVPSPAFG